MVKQNAEKLLDLHETRYRKIFEVADLESGLKSKY